MKKDVWETIDTYTDRLKVPGGWVVRSLFTWSTGVSVHQVFISDPNYEWKIVQ